MRAKETWVLVADRAGARLLRADGAGHRLELVAGHRHPAGLAKASGLVADRQGRSFDSSHAGGRHALEAPTDPKRAERRRFAGQLAGELEAAAAAGRFDELVLVAEPRMLGELRAALTARVARAIDKDLAGLDGPRLGRHLAPLLWP